MIQNKNFSYNGILNILESFASAHLDVRRYISEDLDQMSEITSKGQEFPVMFVTPISNAYDYSMHQHSIRIYVYDRLLKDRSNIDDLRSKTNQVISDLNVWLLKDDLPVETTSISSSYPFSSELMTDVTGWYVDVTIDNPSYEPCKIPFATAPVISGYTCDIHYTNDNLTCDDLASCPTIVSILESVEVLSEEIVDINAILAGIPDFSALEAEVAALTDDVAALTLQVGGLSATVSDLDTLVGEFEPRVTNLETNLATVTSDLAALRSDLDDLIARVDDNDTSIEFLVTSVTTINSNITTINTTISALSATVSDLETLIADLTTADVPDSINRRYVTDAEKTIISGSTASFTTAEKTKLSNILPLATYDYWAETRFQTNNVLQQNLLGVAIASGTATTAPPIIATNVNYPYGVFMRSSASANSGYRWSTTLVNSLFFGTLAYKYQAVYMPKTAFTDITDRIGFIDTTNQADAVDGVYFEVVGSTVNCKTADNSFRSTVTMTATLSIDTPYLFDIEINAAGTEAIYKLINADTGALIETQTNTTNIPISHLRGTGVGFIATKSSITAADIGVLYYVGYGTLAGFNKARNY